MIDRGEFNGLMRLLNDAYGSGYGGQSTETWYTILGKYELQDVRDAIWQLAETMKMKPRIADIIDTMRGNGIVGGGSEKVEPNGCTFCGGSGWASAEVSPGEIVMFRCMCERGSRLGSRYKPLTDDLVRDRYVNLRGELRIRNPEEERREAKIAMMPLDEKIAWCKKGLERIGGRL